MDTDVHGYRVIKVVVEARVMKLISTTTKSDEGMVIRRAHSRLMFSTRSWRRDAGTDERQAMKQSVLTSASWMAKGRGEWIGLITLTSGERIRVRIATMLIVLCLVLFGCDVVVPREQPVTLDIIADAGGGSSAFSSAALGQTLGALVPQLPEGSVIRLHVVSDTVEESRELGSFPITGPKKRSAKAIKLHRERLSREAQQYFGDLAKTIESTKRRGSPIAETIARVLLSDALPGTVRHVAVYTDAKQYSTSVSLGRQDWECGPIPTPDEFTPLLEQLIGMTTKGVHLYFANVQHEKTDREKCASGIERYAQLRTVWTESFTRLGAHVTWTTRPLSSLSEEQ